MASSCGCDPLPAHTHTHTERCAPGRRAVYTAVWPGGPKHSFERVFELGRVLRNEGLSPRHNPEFTSLEVYQAYADYADMARLIERLVSHVAVATNGTDQLEYAGRALDLAPPWRR